MPQDPRRPAQSLPARGLVRPVRTDERGTSGPTRGQAAGPRWRQTSRGFHVPTWVDGALPEQRVLEASVRLPPGGCVTGWAALRLLGAWYVDGLAPDGRSRLPVPLVVGRHGHVRGHPGVRVLREQVEADERTVRQTVPCVTAERATLDAMRLAPTVREAVVAVDMAAAAELVSLARMRSYLASRTRRPGLVRARAALELASEHSWSPNETRLRLIWVGPAGLPAPRVNQPVFDRRGRLLGYPDLLDEESGLVVEYDGADHRRAARHADDVGREDLLRRHRLEVTRVTGPDLARESRVVTRLLTARQRALWLPADRRSWTVEPPAGWEAGPSLDALLDHRDFMTQARRSWPDS